MSRYHIDADRCPVCNVQFPESQMEEHIGTQHGSCPICRVSFQADQMREHMAQHAHKAQKTARKKARRASRKKLRMAQRASGSKRAAVGRQAPPPVVVQQLAKRLRPCSLCGYSVREECIDQHFQSCHVPDDRLEPATQRLPFVLLPPASSSIRLIDHRGATVFWLDPINVEALCGA